MISPNELRIGNWIIDAEGKYIEVYSIETGYEFVNIMINCDYDEISGDAFDKIKPIPLTPEILEKAGFEDSVKGLFKIWYDNHAGYGINYRDTFLMGIDNLHELQNLYFALTGEELTITL